MSARPIVPGLLYLVRSRSHPDRVVAAANGCDAIAKTLEHTHD